MQQFILSISLKRNIFLSTAPLGMKNYCCSNTNSLCAGFQSPCQRKHNVHSNSATLSDFMQVYRKQQQCCDHLDAKRNEIQFKRKLRRFCRKTRSLSAARTVASVRTHIHCVHMLDLLAAQQSPSLMWRGTHGVNAPAGC